MGYEVQNGSDQGLCAWASSDHALISGRGKGGVAGKRLESMQLEVVKDLLSIQVIDRQYY